MNYQHQTNTESSSSEKEVFAIAHDPFDKKNTEFLINRHQWLSLWVYISSHDQDSWDPNYTEERAIKTARILEEKVKDGDFASWCENWNKECDPSYKISEKHLKDFINFSGFSGGFSL